MLPSPAARIAPRFVPFGKYLLLERIAIGGMAEVYLAKTFDRGVPSELLAVKRILPALAADAEFIRMFLDEAKIAGGLAHPGIVQIRELGRVGSSHYLAMDFVWGKDLLHVARRCRMLDTQLSPAFVAWVGAGVCEALTHAHEKRDRSGRAMGIVHRDVSPQNVLVSFDGKVKLIDFGIAKAQSRSTQTQAGVLKGKVGYMSPEQVRGEPIDARSDLFALGTCLYELLTLRALFARENAFDAMENVRHVRARPIRELRADVPEELERILSRALTADRDARWSSARELGGALLAFLNLVEPGFDRIAAVTWVRDAFRKELHAERVRLEALDQVGRPQLSPADEPRRNSVTDLEITGIGDVPPPDWDEEGETLVYDEPIPFVDSEPPDEGPAEIFFRSDTGSIAVHPSPARQPLEPGRSAAPPPAPRWAADQGQLAGDADIELAPAQIDSGVIRHLMPTPDEKREAAREPTSRHRFDRSGGIDPPVLARRGLAWRVVPSLLLLALGAALALAWVTMTGDAHIEVRTTPEGAMVLLDGVIRGAAPLRLDGVPPGRHVLTVLADGYEDATRELELGANGAAVIDVALVARAGADSP